MVLGETIMGQDTFWLWLEWVVWMCVVVLCALGALVFSCWTTLIGARLLRRLLDGPQAGAGQRGEFRK
jgi:hypothetical protein